MLNNFKEVGIAEYINITGRLIERRVAHPNTENGKTEWLDAIGNVVAYREKDDYGKTHNYVLSSFSAR